jgi:putative ABC transport system substrate-binding protein
VAAKRAAELVRLDLDLIVAASSVYVPQLRQLNSTIPIVFCFAADPVAEGIVASLARPGGNSTGISSQRFDAKSLEFLTQALPRARRIAVLWDPTFSPHKEAITAVEAAARNLAVELRPVPVRTADEIDAAFAAIVDTGADALLALPSSMTYAYRARLADFALTHRLPGMFPILPGAAGGLLSYDVDTIAQFQHCPIYVDKILKGAKPAELPVEQGSTFHLVINLKTAKALGLTIPPSLLARADEVIE